MPQQWQQARESEWSYNAIIKIFETETDFNEYVCSQSICESIWISIDATYPPRNNTSGEYKFHSIIYNAPAYRNSDNYYLAYDGYDEWRIMPEKCFLDGVTCGFFQIDSKGTLK